MTTISSYWRVRPPATPGSRPTPPTCCRPTTSGRCATASSSCWPAGRTRPPRWPCQSYPNVGLVSADVQRALVILPRPLLEPLYR